MVLYDHRGIYHRSIIYCLFQIYEVYILLTKKTVISAFYIDVNIRRS